LNRVSDSQRATWTQTPPGLHWPQLDKDISFESFTWDDHNPHTLLSKEVTVELAMAIA
jgi:hypothetical protein